MWRGAASNCLVRSSDCVVCYDTDILCSDHRASKIEDIGLLSSGLKD